MPRSNVLVHVPSAKPELLHRDSSCISFFFFSDINFHTTSTQTHTDTHSDRKMADAKYLKEDDYLSVSDDTASIVYHPNLNVILVFTQSGEVRVLDVNSGIILHSCSLAGDECQAPRAKYLPDQDKVLFWNQSGTLGLRGDYNGVLLLDTILQTPICQADDTVKVELLLSEAVLLLQCIQSLEQQGLENTTDVINELNMKISEAQQNNKKGIKAQRVSDA